MAVNTMAPIPSSTGTKQADWEQNSTNTWHNGYCSCFSTIQCQAKSKSHIKTQGSSRLGILSTLTGYTYYHLVLDTGFERPLILLEVEVSRISRHWQVMKIMLSAEHFGCLYPQHISLVLISVTNWVDLKAIAQTEVSQWKITMTPSGIETTTFQLVV